MSFTPTPLSLTTQEAVSADIPLWVFQPSTETNLTGIPTKSTGLVVNIAQGVYEFSWDASPNSVGYVITCQIKGYQKPPTVIGHTITTSISIFGLSAAYNYLFTVKPYSRAGVGSPATARVALDLSQPFVTPTYQPYALVTGSTGSIGLQREPGLNGTSGATGATGATEATGATGFSGQTGATGAIGMTGSIGLTGATGANGARGNTGAQGTTGLEGQTGLTGQPEQPEQLTQQRVSCAREELSRISLPQTFLCLPHRTSLL